MSNSTLLRILLFAGMILYAVSPVDAAPGLLVDDAIVIVAGIIAAKKIKSRNQ